MMTCVLSLTRAINHFHADIYKPYADRLTPVAAIPLNTPQEGIEELEFAQKLGLKAALIPVQYVVQFRLLQRNILKIHRSASLCLLVRFLRHRQ